MSESDLDRLIAGYLARIDAGLPVDPLRLIAEHPQHAAELASFLADAALIGEAIGTLPEGLGPSSADDTTRELRASPNHDTAVEGELRWRKPGWIAALEGGRLAGFQLLEEVGRGGMGIVFKARRLSDQAIVAVKMMLHGPLAGDQAIARFKREARILGELRHPGIVSIEEVGERDGLHYLVMDFVEGDNLQAVCRQGPTEPLQAAAMAAAIARAIHAAHEHGLIHRDLKPANVLLDGEQPRVTDFGLARGFDCSAQLTRSSQLVGTPAYLAPELLREGSQATTSSIDIYAIGAILFELLSGEAPFHAETTAKLLLEILQREPRLPRQLRRSLPPGLEQICMTCLAKHPHQRYPDAASLAADLERVIAGQLPQRRRRRRGWVGAAAAAVALVALSAGLAVGLGPAGAGAASSANGPQAAVSSRAVGAGAPSVSARAADGSSAGSPGSIAPHSYTTSPPASSSAPEASASSAAVSASADASQASSSASARAPQARLPLGRFYATHEGKLALLDRAGKLRKQWNVGAPTDIAIDSAGRIWVADAANRRVIAVDRQGEVERSLAVGGEPRVVLPLLGDRVLIGLANPPQLVILDERDGEPRWQTLLPAIPVDVAPLPDGWLVAYDHPRARLAWLDLQGRQRWSSDPALGLHSPAAMAVTRTGDVLLIDSGLQALLVLDPFGRERARHQIPGARGLAALAGGGAVITTDRGLVRYDGERLATLAGSSRELVRLASTLEGRRLMAPSDPLPMLSRRLGEITQRVLDRSAEVHTLTDFGARLSESADRVLRARMAGIPTGALLDEQALWLKEEVLRLSEEGQNTRRTELQRLSRTLNQLGDAYNRLRELREAEGAQRRESMESLRKLLDRFDEDWPTPR